MKLPKRFFPKQKTIGRLENQGRGSPGTPQAPQPRSGGPRLPGLWDPWATSALGLSPINSLKSQKKSGDHRKYFSVAASFCLRKIPSGVRPGALPEGDSDKEGFFINTMTSPMMREQFTIDLRVHSQQLDGFFTLLDLQCKVLHDLHGDLSDVIFFCSVFVEIR